MPSNLQLIDAGTKRLGSYTDVSDLSEVQTQVEAIENDIRELLNNEGLDVDANETITVTSAQSQVVAGTFSLRIRVQYTTQNACTQVQIIE